MIFRMPEKKKNNQLGFINYWNFFPGIITYLPQFVASSFLCCVGLNQISFEIEDYFLSILQRVFEAENCECLIKDI